MPTCRVFSNPDGTLRVMRLNERHRLPNETDAQFFAREMAKQPELAALPFVDMDAAAIPADRSTRHAWRVDRGRVVVDPTIPPQPTARQQRRAAIDAAQTVDDLKAVLRQMVGA